MEGGLAQPPASGGGPLPDETARDFAAKFDAVVMLTWSDWATEPRSNRYHYASRFARHVPVLFVQPDARGLDCVCEPTELPGVTVVHAPPGTAAGGSDDAQARGLARALRERGVLRPLVWVYNPGVAHFLRHVFSPLKVYHATEDYVSGDYFRAPDGFLADLHAALEACDVLVAVSEGVERAYREHTPFAGHTLVATNGCDYEFLAAGPEPARPSRPVAFYQGGINNRLDLALIRDTAARLPEWDFRFCGRSYFAKRENALRTLWETILRAPNVTYLGQLSPEELRRESRAATVGLIPFTPNPTIVDRSFPLKAFEYVACGLPVVSVPVKSLRAWPDLFTFAEDAEGMAKAIEAARRKRDDRALLALRAREAALQGYDGKFRSVVELINRSAPRPRPRPRRVLVLFDEQSTRVKTVEAHLRSFLCAPASEVCFAPCTWGSRCQYDLSGYDAVVVHYSVRPCVPGHLARSFTRALREYAGLKVLFVQDEYDHTDLTKAFIRDAGVQCVFTCVPPESVRRVYHEPQFDRVQFVQTLTGYVPPEAELRARPIMPLSERRIVIGYRGRDIGWWYGDLAREKLLIGIRMREACDARGLKTDIAWTDDRRVYGPAWYDFLSSCRATLGTESGSNVFDFDGTLKARVEAERRRNPSVTYDEVHARYLREHEGRVARMNQISPKLFEAIALRTALVLFEGTYSGVVQPDVHYIPLRKDFSNVDDVLCKVQDDDLLRGLTARAYDDVVASGRYSYVAFAREFDGVLDRLLGPAARRADAASEVYELGPAGLPLAPPDRPPGLTALLLAVLRTRILTRRVLGPARGVASSVLSRVRRTWRGRKAG